MAVARLAGPKFEGKTSRLKTQAGFLCYRLQAKCLLFWETSVFALKAFK